MMEEKKHCKWYNEEFCTNDQSPCVADFCPVVEYPELCKCREVAEDINVPNKTELSDEEIIKALECMAGIIQRDCDDCPFMIDKFCSDTELSTATIELIHRLQSEKKELDESCELFKHFNDKLNGVIAEQKAEIERLKERKERITRSKKEYLDWVHGFLTTHTEMKDRGKDYKMFDRDWMCEVFWAKIEGAIEYVIDLENQRNKLQKQVDELEGRLWASEGAVKVMSNAFGRERERADKAVKDTAEKYHAEIDKAIDSVPNATKEFVEAWKTKNDEIRKELEDEDAKESE